MAETKHDQYKTATESASVVHVVNDAEKTGRDHINSGGYAEIWLEAINAYLGKGDTTIPGGVNVKLNRLRPDIATIHSRHMKFLLGQTPYMPLEARRPEFAQLAQGVETVVNDLAIDGAYYETRSTMFQMMLGLGHAYSEARWGAWVENINEREPVVDEVLGVIKGYDRVLNPKVTEGLHYIARGPWEVLPHPHGNTLFEKPSIVVKELLHYSEIEKMLDMGTFRLPDDVKSEELRKAPNFHGGEEWADQWRRDRGIMSDNAAEGIGVFCRYYANPTPDFPGGRWIYAWNYQVPLLHDENMNTNMRLDQKPLTAYRDVTHIGPDRFFGQGLWEQTRDKIWLIDDMRSFYFNELLLRLQGWLLYDPELVDRQNLDAQYGNRIPIKQAGRMADAIHEVPRQPIEVDLLGAAGELDADLDNQLGTFYPQTGEPAPRKETFGTTQLIAQAGDTRMEAKTRLVELTSFQEEATYSAKLVSANITQTQLGEMLGEEKAEMMLSMDPASIPGGVRWKFQGSASITRKAQQDQMLIDWWNLAGGDPSLQAPHIPKRKLAKATGRFTDDEIDQMYPTIQEQGFGPDPNAPPPEYGSVTAEQAIANPNEISTPALNAAANTGV